MEFKDYNHGTSTVSENQFTLQEDKESSNADKSKIRPVFFMVYTAFLIISDRPSRKKPSPGQTAPPLYARSCEDS